MNEESEKELIQEDKSLESPDDTPSESVKPDAQETDISGNQPEKKQTVSAERIRLENAAYQKHFAALQAEIEDIRKRYPLDSSEPENDTVTRLYGEVNELRTGFDELKELIQQKQQQTPQQNVVAQQQYTPYQQVFPQPSPYFQPMFQTSTIMPAPPLPFISTPTFAPANTIPPTMGNNNFGLNSNGGK